MKKNGGEHVWQISLYINIEYMSQIILCTHILMSVIITDQRNYFLNFLLVCKCFYFICCSIILYSILYTAHAGE